MSKKLSPDAWGDAATEWGPEFFAIRVMQESDPARLRAAAQAEADRDETRPDRIARINKQIARIQS